MKSPLSFSFPWLLAIGAAVVLLAGAFAHFDSSAVPNSPLLASSDALAAAPPEAAGEPNLPADLSPGLAEIIRLAQAHVGDGVILSYIQTSGQVYTPTAEEILYLSDLGVPQNVIAALFKDKPPPAMTASVPVKLPPAATAPDATAPLPPPGAPDSSFFYNDLAPYGSWVELPDYGLSWQPAAVTMDADWCPYLDRGQWVDSDSGWYWQSDYTWGWAPFHYGRWVKEPRFGWVWVPGNLWAPAWVAWRSAGSYYGWAPLPPGASVLGAAGSLTSSSFVFVNAHHFLSHQPRGKIVPAAQVGGLFAQSTLLDNYKLVNNKVVSGGISREAVAAATGKASKPVALRSVSSPSDAAGALSRSTLAVYRPDPAAAAATAWSQAMVLNVKKSPAEPAATSPAKQEEEPAATDTAVEENAALAQAGSPDLQLPPLHYASAVAPPVPVKNLATLAAPTSTSLPRPVHHHRMPHPDLGQTPATPPPPVEQRTASMAEGARESEMRRPPPPAPPVNPAGPAARVASSTHR